MSAPNFLDLRCPKCGGTEEIDILASVWIRVMADGTDADMSRNGDYQYDPGSTAICGCGHAATVRDFEEAGES